MGYLQQHFNKRVDTRVLFEGASSVVVVALSYHRRDEPHGQPAPAGKGRVAMYAWGEDYHTVLKDKLHALADRLHEQIPESFETKVCVDTVPLVEREVAAAAGVGWIGKNTMSLHPALGSYFFLGEIITTLELQPDEPMADHCGTCTACLDACPTQAFPKPYEMDASRCISYLTIEHRGEISDALQNQMGDWVFGCDVCQQVCPHNHAAPETREPRFEVRPPSPRPDLGEIIHWKTDDYRSNLRGSAIKRAKLNMLQRNAEIVLANQRQGLGQP